ncbi:hypothetical protein M758_1G325700 [Ceratodon purpureus]|uniref:Uncharacterized protein n=1 Tax=Ceratodon purpureus TaxID=3225 RepID=A0A8T0JEZ9_CERPU|nr:hypothetical protein KC19_1G332300 [Ceratodon purpureus]KAG0593478.1 hypothetical protein KC19_1G333000 [Ceratodon purpureus]KAG0632396.1 hypothetical protein M758_1G325000 [Ceratodon purpureus]KAG0632405.1 hypothetical protein M758_1G325700 [Ceratodon purpureus]
MGETKRKGMEGAVESVGLIFTLPLALVSCEADPGGEPKVLTPRDATNSHAKRSLVMALVA